MESQLFSAASLSALLAIVLIDLVLRATMPSSSA